MRIAQSANKPRQDATSLQYTLLDGALYVEFLVTIGSKGQNLLYNGSHEIGGTSDERARFVGGHG
jgi:hypothetical protein